MIAMPVASLMRLKSVFRQRIVAYESSTDPMKPPQKTKPPRLKKAPASPVRMT